MDFEAYRDIWNQTRQAEKYLRRKGVTIYCDSVPSGYGDAMQIVLYVSDSDDKAIAHVHKAYPKALVVFVPPEQVAAMQAHKETALDAYLAKVWAE